MITLRNLCFARGGDRLVDGASLQIHVGHKVGLVGAIELVKDKKTHASFDPKLAVGPTLVKFAHEHGLIVRPVIDSLCFCPPMVSTEAQITDMFGRFGRALKDTHDWLKREGHVA